MPPQIDSAKRRGDKIIFSSQYLLYAHASKKIDTHRSDCRSRRKINDRCKGHLWHHRWSIVYRRAKTLHVGKHALHPQLLLLPQLPLLLQPRLDLLSLPPLFLQLSLHLGLQNFNPNVTMRSKGA